MRFYIILTRKGIRRQAIHQHRIAGHGGILRNCLLSFMLIFIFSSWSCYYSFHEICVNDHARKRNVLQSGYDIQTAQELPKHSDAATTMIYTHV